MSTATWVFVDEIYVDPAIAADSGDGSSGSPYGDFQFLLDSESHSTGFGGTRINVKDGTDEILSADLDFSTNYLSGTPTGVSAPLAIQGYTATAGDGGIGGVNGDGSFSFVDEAALDFVMVVNMHCHNAGTSPILVLDNFCTLLGSEFDNSSNAVPVVMGETGSVIGSHFHDGANVGTFGSMIFYRNKFIDDKTNQSFTTVALEHNGSNCISVENEIWLDTAAVGGMHCGTNNFIYHNSVFQNAAGTDIGIAVTSTASSMHNYMGNLVEGFSGAGGIGIRAGNNTTSRFANYIDANYVFNCTNEYDRMFIALHGDQNNEIGTVSPFLDGPNKDFTPVNTGNIKEGSLPAIIGQVLEGL